MEFFNLIAAVAGLIIFEVAAGRHGVDSTDSLVSPEWERRRSWRGSGAGRGAR